MEEDSGGSHFQENRNRGHTQEEAAGSLFLPTEVAQGNPGLTLWSGGQPWTLVSALGACTGGMSRSLGFGLPPMLRDLGRLLKKQV